MALLTKMQEAGVRFQRDVGALKTTSHAHSTAIAVLLESSGSLEENLRQLQGTAWGLNSRYSYGGFFHLKRLNLKHLVKSSKVNLNKVEWKQKFVSPSLKEFYYSINSNTLKDQQESLLLSVISIVTHFLQNNSMQSFGTSDTFQRNRRPNELIRR